MASKEEQEQTQDTPQAEPENAPETNVTPQSDTPQRLHSGITYLERTWREVPMYQCPNCSYNNVSLEDFANYQGRTCRRPECPIQKGAQRQSNVVDRFGNPVIVTERT